MCGFDTVVRVRGYIWSARIYHFLFSTGSDPFCFTFFKFKKKIYFRLYFVKINLFFLLHMPVSPNAFPKKSTPIPDSVYY